MFECPTCERNFSSKQKLKGHVNKKNKCVSLTDLLNDDEDKPFACENCGKRFSYKHHLKIHTDSVFTKCFLMQMKNQEKTRINIGNIINNNIDKQIIDNKQITNIDNKQITNIDNKQITNIGTIVVPQIGFVKTGNERIDHITRDVLLRILNINNFPRVCVEFMKELYFNKKVPENHNWFIAYPKDGKAAIVYDDGAECFIRASTTDVINEKFDNMMHLLQPLIEELYKEDELNNNLTNVQRMNLKRFYGFFGSYEISNDSPAIYNDIHDLAYNYQNVPKLTWKEQGLDANHLSIKL